MVLRGEVYVVTWRSLWCYVEKSMVLHVESIGKYVVFWILNQVTNQVINQVINQSIYQEKTD